MKKIENSDRFKRAFLDTAAFYKKPQYKVYAHAHVRNIVAYSDMWAARRAGKIFFPA